MAGISTGVALGKGGGGSGAAALGSKVKGATNGTAERIF